MFCSQCGTQLKEGAFFCTNCGAKQETAQVPPVQSVETDLDKTVGAFSTIPDFAQFPPVQPEIIEDDMDKTVGAFNTIPEFVQASPVQENVEEAPVEEFAQPEIVEDDMDKTVGAFNTVPEFAQPPMQEPVYQVPPQDQYSYVSPEAAPHNGSVSFGQAVSLFFKNYANFKGRASKSEYWWAFLFNMILNIPIALISSAVPPLGGLCSVALMIPGISLAVRRLHDVGLSGKSYFMGFIPVYGIIYLLPRLLRDSDGDNQYGPGPYSV